MEENKKTEPVSGQAVMTVKDLRTALKTRQGILYPVDGVSLEIPKGKIIGLVGELWKEYDGQLDYESAPEERLYCRGKHSLSG